MDLDEHTPKRVKLEFNEAASGELNDTGTDHQANKAVGEENLAGGGGEETEDNCSICLHQLDDRTVIPNCSHEFCFECLIVWTAQSRRCPLCNQPIGEYIIHSIRSRYDYRKHFLAPPRSSPPPSQVQRDTNPAIDARRNALRRRRERERIRRQQDDLSELDKFERSLAKRRWVYRHDLYAKHVASNSYTKYRPYPNPAIFAASSDLISRTMTFLRRELQVWEGLDVEFLTVLIISLIKSIDIRSESAVKLLSEFLDLDGPCVPGGRRVNAEHFAHEVYCYVRSPYKDLFMYDAIVQYDTPPELQPPLEIPRRRRWDQTSRSKSRSPPDDSRTRSRQNPELGRTLFTGEARPPNLSSNTHQQAIPSNSRQIPNTGNIDSDNTPYGGANRLAGYRHPLGESGDFYNPANVDTNIHGQDAMQTEAPTPHVVDAKGKGKAASRPGGHSPILQDLVVEREPILPAKGTLLQRINFDNSEKCDLRKEPPRPSRNILAGINAYLCKGNVRPNSGEPLATTPGTRTRQLEFTPPSRDLPPSSGSVVAVNEEALWTPAMNSLHSKQPHVRRRGDEEGSTVKSHVTPKEDPDSKASLVSRASSGNGGASVSSNFFLLSGFAEAPEGRRPNSHVRSPQVSIEDNSIREPDPTLSSINHQEDRDFGGNGRSCGTLIERLQREKHIASDMHRASSELWKDTKSPVSNDGSSSLQVQSCPPNSIEPNESRKSVSLQRELLLIRLEAEKRKIYSVP